MNNLQIKDLTDILYLIKYNNNSNNNNNNNNNNNIAPAKLALMDVELYKYASHYIFIVRTFI